MKRRNRELEIFSLSFLDVISCGFGAVVMLILISKTSPDVSVASTDDVSALLSTLVSLQSSTAKTQQEITEELNALKQVSGQKQSLSTLSSSLEKKLKALEQKNASMNERVEGLSLVEETLKQASLSTPKKTNTKRDAEVGGIPVDSDYVIFIVDTSGSMQQIWGRVTAEIVNVLNIHPKVKGFQILNDMGTPLISGYEGKWIPDTPSRRKNVIQFFKTWGAFSNSSPLEGLSTALLR